MSSAHGRNYVSATLASTNLISRQNLRDPTLVFANGKRLLPCHVQPSLHCSDSITFTCVRALDWRGGRRVQRLPPSAIASPRTSSQFHTENRQDQAVALESVLRQRIARCSRTQEPTNGFNSAGLDAPPALNHRANRVQGRRLALSRRQLVPPQRLIMPARVGTTCSKNYKKEAKARAGGAGILAPGWCISPCSCMRPRLY